MYSRRLDWNPGRNRIAQLLERRRPSYDLTESNPTRAGLHWPEGLLEGLRDERGLSYDPDPKGLLEARERVAEYEQAPVDQVLLTSSSSEAYAWLFKLLCDPGDEVLVPQPSYPLFEFLARLESVRTVAYPLFYDRGWCLDVAGLEQALTSRSRAIVVVNPNNPTGSYLKRRELEQLERLCAAHDLALISDEVFSDYALQDSASEERVKSVARAAATKVTAFSLSGLSKVCGLPQLKLGWMVSNSAAALERLELIADTYLSVSTPVQLAAGRLLASRHGIQEQIVRRARANLALVPEALQVEGGWYAILRVPPVKSEEDWVVELLESYGVLVQPGFFYDFPRQGAHLVLSLLTPEPVFQEGLRLIRRALSI